MYIAIAIHIMFILWCIPILHSMVYTYITFYGVYVYYNALTPVYTLPLPCTVSQQGLAAAVRWSGRLPPITLTPLLATQHPLIAGINSHTTKHVTIGLPV